MSKDNAPEENHEEDIGVTRKQFASACIRNNTDELHKILESDFCTPEFLNAPCLPTGETGLYLAAQYGNPDILDILLDQDGLEADPVLDFQDGSTPLHAAVRYSEEKDKLPISCEMVDYLVDAGCDPRLKTKLGGLKPIDLVKRIPDAELKMAEKKWQMLEKARDEWRKAGEEGPEPEETESRTDADWVFHIRLILENGEAQMRRDEAVARELATLGHENNDDDEAGSGSASDSE